MFTLFGAGACSGEIVIAQNVITAEADYGSLFGQSFLLPAGGKVSAIQLHIGSVGRGGGSALLRLWETDETPGRYLTRKGASPVATGSLDRERISVVPEWYTITLDQTYTNETGEPLPMVFDVELTTSGLGGWNDYSFSNLGSYADGDSVRWSINEYVIRDGEDLTFRVLDPDPEVDIPIPRMTIIAEPNATLVSILVYDSVKGFDYTLYQSNNLSSWREFFSLNATQSGNGGALVWGYKPLSGRPDKEYFFVEITPN